MPELDDYIVAEFEKEYKRIKNIGSNPLTDEQKEYIQNGIFEPLEYGNKLKKEKENDL